MTKKNTNDKLGRNICPYVTNKRLALHERLQQVSEIEDGRVNKEQNLQNKCLQRETVMKNKSISSTKSIDKGDRYHKGWGRLGG